jgi:hypothetical protein
VYIHDGEPEDAAPLAEAVSANTHLQAYDFHEAYALFADDRIMRALVDNKQLRALHFSWCDLRPVHAPLLAQALAHLDRLLVSNASRTGVDDFPGLLSEETIDVFCDAVKASRLSELGLCDALATTASMGDNGAKLLAAMTGHPSLRCITLGYGFFNHHGTGAALARLLNAGGALRELVLDTDLRVANAELVPLFEAVGRSTTLTSLSVSIRLATDESLRSTIIPAIVRNTSLRHVFLGDYWHMRLKSEIGEAVERVSARYE